MTEKIDPLIRQQLMDVVLRYAAGIDRRDWQLLRSCFTDDCKADYGDAGQWNSGDELTAFMEQVHRGCGHTMHWIGNHVIHADREGYAGRTYSRGVILRADNRKGRQIYGYYDDRFVPAEGGWKIASRRFTETLTVRIAAYPEN
jgi:hypothetical protein